jgi:hypothetical protein
MHNASKAKVLVNNFITNPPLVGLRKQISIGLSDNLLILANQISFTATERVGIRQDIDAGG